MFKKPFSLSFELDMNDKEDESLHKKIHSRDRYTFKSLNDFLKAAVAAFDEPNPYICYDAAAREELLKKLDSLLDKKSEALKSHLYNKTVEKFGL